MKNIELAKKHEDYILQMRRHFHENPELSGQEFETIKRICRELDAMGIEYIEVENGGVLGFIEGPKPGRTVLLRADVDALPVQETADNLKPGMRTCISKVPGVMHACGHDGHTAMLLGAAKILLEKKDELEGRVVLCFERGEEGGGNVKYIFRYIEKNNIQIDACYGIHLWANAPAGYMVINDKNMMAGGVWFDITIEGRGGHGSRPDQSISPLDAFWAFYGGLQQLRLTKIDPYEPLTYSIGLLEAGAVGNVIPQTLHFAGSARLFDAEVAGQRFYDEFVNLLENTCKAYHCVPKYNALTKPMHGTINHPDMAQWARKVIGRDIGEEKIGTYEPWMGSESYGTYMRQWPGVLAFIGMNNPEKGVGAAHHNQAFDIDEDVLYLGAAGAATYAMEYLKDSSLRGGRLMGYREIIENDPMTTPAQIKELYGDE